MKIYPNFSLVYVFEDTDTPVEKQHSQIQFGPLQSVRHLNLKVVMILGRTVLFKTGTCKTVIMSNTIEN